MHLAEGLLPLRHVVVTTMAAVPFLVLGVIRSRGSSLGHTGMATALLFAVTLFPIPVPVVGVTSHMCATPILGLLLSPIRMIVPTTLVLLMQALFFAHGGLSTLGANVLTLGVLGPGAAWLLARPLRLFGLGPALSVGVACSVADAMVYLADAVLLSSTLAPWSGIPSVAFKLVVAMAPAQVPLALLEGILSASLLAALARKDPEHLPRWLRAKPSAVTLSSATVCFIAVITCAPAVQAASWQGLDDSILAAAARAQGRHSAPVLDLESGDLGKAIFGGSMLFVGFVLGAGWKGMGGRAGRAS